MGFNLGDIGKLGSLMKNMKGIQEEMLKAKEALEHEVIEAEAGAGDVKVTMTASQKMLSIEIADHLIDIDNKAVMQELIVGAVQVATEKAKDTAKQKMAEVSSQFGMPMPGDMGDLF